MTMVGLRGLVSLALAALVLSAGTIAGTTEMSARTVARAPATPRMETNTWSSPRVILHGCWLHVDNRCSKADTIMDFTNTGPVVGPDPWRARLDAAERFNLAHEPRHDDHPHGGSR